MSFTEPRVVAVAVRSSRTAKDRRLHRAGLVHDRLRLLDPDVRVPLLVPGRVRDRRLVVVRVRGLAVRRTRRTTSEAVPDAAAVAAPRGRDHQVRPVQGRRRAMPVQREDRRSGEIESSRAARELLTDCSAVNTNLTS